MINNTINKKILRIYSHSPPLVKEAFNLQKELSSKVIESNSFNKVKTIAGIDMAIFPKQKKMVCGIIIYSYPDLVEIERVWKIVDEKFPYIPGLLAFREGPAIIDSFNMLKIKPDIAIIDGHGIAHPRGFGIACHIGVLLDIPTFGVGKKKLYGIYKEPSKLKGSYSYIKDGKTDKIIGVVIRMKDNVKPVFVSIGNKIDLKTAQEIVLKCDSGYRIPTPTRQADKFVAEIKREVNLGAG